MIITKNVFCEFIVRDFAKKYLDFEESFELHDIMKLNINKFPSRISNSEIYTLADVRFCMRNLGLINSFSHIKIDEYERIETKDLIYYQNIEESISLYDIIRSLPDNGSYIRKCSNCGKLFIANHKNRKYCNGFDADGNLCSKIGPSKIHNNDSIEDKCIRLFSRYYRRNWNNYKRNKISKDEFEKWKIDAKNKCDEVINEKISYGDLEKWMDKTQKELFHKFDRDH